MYVKQSYDDDFEHFMLDMKDKYPKSIFELNGISDDDLDHTKFAKKYFTKKNTADISSDSNANVQIKNIATFNIERHKGSDKLDSLFLFWKTAKKQYGLREANRLVEKELCKDVNIQDSSNFYLPYCFAFDTYDLLIVGLPFVVNYPSSPAKHSDAFWQHTIQLLQYAAPQMMGATAIPNFIVIYSGLIKYDSIDENYPIPNYTTHAKLFERYVKQRFQELVFTLNQPLRQVQSTFSNITIFDKFFMKEICSKYIIKEGIIDYEFAMYIQKLFLETLNDLNNTQIATYPILTAQFKKDSNGEIEDEEFIDFISKINLPTGHLNLFNDESLNALSSCCFEGKEILKIKKKGENIWFYISIKDFVELYNTKNKDSFESKIEEEYIINSFNINTKIFEETYITGVLKLYNKYNKLIEIELEDGFKNKVTYDHIFIVLDTLENIEKEVKAEELVNNTGRYLLLSEK